MKRNVKKEGEGKVREGVSIEKRRDEM